MTNKLLIVTGNENKVREFERIMGIKLDHEKLDLPEIQSTDVAEVAKIKAENAYQQLGRPCFVDDTGLTIHKWGELPGALIRWFLVNVEVDGIVNMLGDTTERSASVTTAIGYCDENGPKVFTGTVNGSIATGPTGDNGFGYDPIFIPEGQPKTFAEMASTEKDQFSMRTLAAQALKEGLGDKMQSF